jgi:lipopolysaccharide/colanic/teichoic acid biosynthesis glycosyltransferase
MLDIALGGVGLAVSSPFLALAAVAVKVEDGGPVFYRQSRVGKGGVDFELLKLRTMVVGAEKLGAGYAVDKGDARITRTGRLLRRLSIDELPQLWNVVRGDMSVIGPRPTLRYQVEQYDERQRRRLEVKPGITGWAQVNGRAGIGWEERIELDIFYVDNRSPLLDAKILARTPRVLLAGSGATATGGADSELPASWKREKTED